jgi:hypothetical protein
MTLETSLRKHGHFEEADQVYVELRHRQGKELSFGFAKLWNRLLDYSVEYGKKLHRVLYIIGLFLLLGAVIFRRKYMMPRGQEGNCIRYFSPFYSIDLFVPVINMYWTKDWMPKKEYKFVNIWMFIHAVLGWLLVPFALAVWSGIIK